MKTLKRSELYAKLNELQNEIFTLTYLKSDGTIRTATGKLHVNKPEHTLIPGTGKFIGESATNALTKHNNLKYFDLTVDGKFKTGKGDYRTAKIDRIQKVIIAGETYKLVD